MRDRKTKRVELLLVVAATISLVLIPSSSVPTTADSTSGSNVDLPTQSCSADSSHKNGAGFQPNDFANETILNVTTPTTLNRGEDLPISATWQYDNLTSISSGNTNVTVLDDDDAIIYNNLDTFIEGEFSIVVPYLPLIYSSRITVILNFTSEFINGTKLHTVEYDLQIPALAQLIAAPVHSTVKVTPGEPKNITVEVFNIGNMTARGVNITATRSALELVASHTPKDFKLQSIDPGASVIIGTVVNVSTYCVGSIVFDIVYMDPISQVSPSSPSVQIQAIPAIGITFLGLPTKMIAGETITASGTLYTGELMPVVLTVRLTGQGFVTSSTIVVVSSTSTANFTVDMTSQIVGVFIIELQNVILWDGDHECIVSRHPYTIQVENPASIMVSLSADSSSNWDTMTVLVSGAIVAGTFLAAGIWSREALHFLRNRVRLKPGTLPFLDDGFPYRSDIVVVDGSNVAWEEKDNRGRPKVKNLELAINELATQGFTKVLVVADAALRYQIDDQRSLTGLINKGALKMLPARVDGDYFILRLSEGQNAMILSNDMFKEYRDGLPWIDSRRIPFTILDGQLFLHPASLDERADASSQGGSSSRGVPTKKKSQNPSNHSTANQDRKRTER